MPKIKTPSKVKVTLSILPGQLEILEKVAKMRGGVSVTTLIVGELDWAALSREARDGARVDILDDEYQPHILGTNERAFVRGTR